MREHRIDSECRLCGARLWWYPPDWRTGLPERIVCLAENCDATAIPYSRGAERADVEEAGACERRKEVAR